MKKLLLLLSALILLMVSGFAQNKDTTLKIDSVFGLDSITGFLLAEPTFDIGFFEPQPSIVFSDITSEVFRLSWEDDTIRFTSEIFVEDAAKRFFNTLIRYNSEVIDSLKSEIKRLKYKINWDSINSTINLDAVVWDSTFVQTGYATAAQFTKLEGIATSAIELMFEYSEYCYNDSTYLLMNVFKETNRQEAYPFAGRPELITGYYEYEYKWQHKQPTFKGFIEWLELKWRDEK